MLLCPKTPKSTTSKADSCKGVESEVVGLVSSRGLGDGMECRTARIVSSSQDDMEAEGER